MRFLPKKQKDSASITLEAAMVLPIFLFFIISLLSSVEFFRAYCDVTMNLYYAGKETALYINALDYQQEMDSSVLQAAGDSLLTMGYADHIMQDHFENNHQAADSIREGKEGIAYWYTQSFVSEDIVDLVATYFVTPYCNIFGISDFYLVSRCRLRAWTGYDTGAESELTEERMVYVTETGEVYHLTRSCSYLDLTIMPVDAPEIEALSNVSGQKYSPCSLCGYATVQTYFVTLSGDHYHSSLSCSGIKRTIYEIHFSERGDRPACSRCGS